MKPRVVSAVIFCAFALALVACAPTASVAPIRLDPGNFTALGINPKSDQPTPGDLAELPAAEGGSQRQPAFVEFYGDT